MNNLQEKIEEMLKDKSEDQWQTGFNEVAYQFTDKSFTDTAAAIAQLCREQAEGFAEYVQMDGYVYQPIHNVWYNHSQKQERKTSELFDEYQKSLTPKEK